MMVLFLVTTMISPLIASDPPTVVFVTGDDEYHSREVMRPYADKLEKDYGFKVIYIADTSPGTRGSGRRGPQPTKLEDAERIKEADLMVVYIRFRSWEEESLNLFLDHYRSGKPAVAIRTTTHAFWRDRTFSPKYFGGHYKTHYHHGIVGQIDPDNTDHPMARGVRKKFWVGEGPYVSTPLSDGSIPIMLSYGHNRGEEEEEEHEEDEEHDGDEEEGEDEGEDHEEEDHDQENAGQKLSDIADLDDLSGIGPDTIDSPIYPVAWAYHHEGARRAMITLGSDRVDDHALDFMQNLFYNSVFWSLGYEVPENGVLAAGKDFKMVKEKSAYKPKQKTFEAPPSFKASGDWEVLFDGKNLDKWKHYDVSIPPRGIELDGRAYSEGPIDYRKSPARWDIDRATAVAKVGYGDIITKKKYTNYELRLDFYIPEQPDWVTGQWRGNSGVFINGQYELAIVDSHGQDASNISCGAIYKQHAPIVNASKPAGQWQTLEIKVQGRKLTAKLNGKVIHENLQLDKPTPYGFPKATSGPVRLESSTSSVRFANIAIKPLKVKIEM